MKIKTLLALLVASLLIAVVTTTTLATPDSPLPEPPSPIEQPPKPEEPPLLQPILPETGFESVLGQLGDWLTEMWGLGGVKAIVAQTLLNVVIALAAATKTDSLNIKKLGEFLHRKLLPYVAVYIAAKAFGVSAGVEWVAPIAYVAIFTTLTGDMLDNLIGLGLPIPEQVQRLLLSK